MELTEKQKKLLKDVVDHFDKEDRAVRDRQIRTWRKLKLLWENMQHHYYSEVAHDWRIPEPERSGENSDQSYYDKPVNVFRAYLESIIAALSVSIPGLSCYPDDADNSLDVATAKAGDKIAELIYKHNDAPLLWLHALFIYCTEGMVACHHYIKEDKSFGTYTETQYKEVQEPFSTQNCPQCGMEMGSAVEDYMGAGVQDVCPACGSMVEPRINSGMMTVTQEVGKVEKPKCRVLLDVWGGLYVKVPVYARCQDDIPYLIQSYETHYSNVLAQYPKLWDKFPQLHKNSGVYDTYEQWGRLNPQYHGEYPLNNVTVRNAWLRPSAFCVLQEEDAKYLQKIFPIGAKVVLVNDHVCDAEGESLDDSWTLTYNPLSDFIHFDPIGLLLTSIQEITNDLISLTLQTVEHGIPQTFASPKVLNFNSYGKQEATPGAIYPATPPSGKALSDGFYEVKTATLSGEVLPFANKVQELGQLVSGALPSLFGGQLSGSRTASEYSMSRAQALQRLQNTWKMLTIWWKDIFTKSIPLYILEIKDDERMVKKDEFGSYINSFVRKSELEGKIGSVELEANENLPITWSQQKDTIMQLIETNNESVLATLASPENMPYLRRAIGLTDYNIPGEDDRQKQYEEITMLINSEPFVMPPPTDPNTGMPMMDPNTGMPSEGQELPSVEVDPDIDDHQLEADICRRWLVSDVGRLCKIENTLGYKNVLLHMKAHKDVLMQMQLQQQMQQFMASGGQGAAPPEQPNEKSATPIQGDGDVSTIQ